MTIEARAANLHRALPRWDQISQAVGLGIEALSSPLTVPITIISQRGLGEFLAEKFPTLSHTKAGRILFSPQLQAGVEGVVTIAPLLIAGAPVVTAVAIYGLKKIREIFPGNETSFT